MNVQAIVTSSSMYREVLLYLLFCLVVLIVEAMTDIPLEQVQSANQGHRISNDPTFSKRYGIVQHVQEVIH